LNNLTKKDTPWTWGIPQQQAFQALKETFLQEPILVVWEPNHPTCLEVDASGYATGGVLMEKLDDNLWHPMVFRSQSMIEAERNYEIYDKEMLAIICALEDWHHYLEGLPQPFDIISNHRNLEYWQMAQDLTCQQVRWSLYLSCFDFHLTHKPGTANTQADPLSHISTHLKTDADDNCSQIVLQPNHFASITASSISDSNTLEQEIRNTTNQDPKVVLTLCLLRQHRPRQLTDSLSDWDERDSLIFYKGWIYIPKAPDLRK